MNGNEFARAGAAMVMALLLPSSAAIGQAQPTPNLDKIAEICSGVFSLRAAGTDRRSDVVVDKRDYKITGNSVEIRESGVLLGKIDAFAYTEYRDCIVALVEITSGRKHWDLDGQCEVLQAGWRAWETSANQYQLGKPDQIVRCGRAMGNGETGAWRIDKCHKTYTAKNKTQIDEAAAVFERGRKILDAMGDLSAKAVAVSCFPRPRRR